MLVALIALTGLVALGSLTVLSVQGGLAAAGHDRHKTTALYAAESGAASAMVVLRRNTSWNPFLAEPRTVVIPGEGVMPGQPGNLFSPDTRAWFELEFENNLDDPSRDRRLDSDRVVIIRATGHGPDGAVAVIEWQVGGAGGQPQRHCPSYGQKGMSEDGAGRNDCLGTIISTETATYSPGGP